MYSPNGVFRASDVPVSEIARVGFSQGLTELIRSYGMHIYIYILYIEFMVVRNTKKDMSPGGPTLLCKHSGGSLIK